MSAKNVDHQGRWRSVTVAFRVSPEEDALIESAVRVTGLTNFFLSVNGVWLTKSVPVEYLRKDFSK